MPSKLDYLSQASIAARYASVCNRAYDYVVFAEAECKHAFGEDPSTIITNAHYEKYFDLVKESLLTKRGKPKDDRIRELPQGCCHLQQDKVESISTFAHRF